MFFYLFWFLQTGINVRFALGMHTERSSLGSVERFDLINRFGKMNDVGTRKTLSFYTTHGVFGIFVGVPGVPVSFINWRFALLNSRNTTSPLNSLNY